MKILQLVNRIPYPLNDGGNLAVHACTEGFLQAGAAVAMLAMNTARHWVDTDKLPDMYSRLLHFEAIAVDNRVKAGPALKNLFTRASYNVERFIAPAYEEALSRLLQKEVFDIIQLEGLYLVPYIPVIRRYSKAKVVLRQHNVEFVIWERLAGKETNILKKKYLQLLASRLKRFEIAHINDYDLVLPISEDDGRTYRQLGARVPLFVHPFGVNTADIPFVPASGTPLSLYHIGAMDWLPNRESVDWLLERVMPLINKELPGMKLYLAGRNMPEYYFSRKWDNVEVLGEVPDAMAFEKDKSILLVPLLSGGGVRIKIFQGMAMGKAIVTTSIGVEGIAAQDGKEVMIADTPELFAGKVIDIVRSPGKAGIMGLAARRLVEERYDRARLTSTLLAYFQELKKSAS
jgi:glycosyltransferase involved in cell wall biosynthesis